MPLIEILAAPQPDAVDVTAACRRVNEAVAAAIPCRVDAVWTTWRTIDGASVRGAATTGDDGRPHGPIVHVYHHRSPDQVERAVEAIESVLADALSIDRTEIFVTTQPVALPDATLP